MARKPRSDSKLAALTPSVREELLSWLGQANVSYEEAAILLRERHEVKVSTSALCEWYARHGFQLRAEQARSVAETAAEELAAGPDKFDEATMAMIRQKLFERALAKNGDVAELATLAKIMGDSAKLRIKEKELELSARRVALLEKKAAQADQAKGVVENQTLTAAEREAKLKEIFGLR